MPTPIQWAAQLPHVREVSLLGSADLSYWQARLKLEDLQPLECDNRAQIKIIAADSKFMGLPFREVSFSVGIVPPDPVHGNEAVFLVQAFNSVRFFAWCERTLFGTPYEHGDVRVNATLNAAIHLSHHGRACFAAVMSAPVAPIRPAIDRGNESWEGTVFLPSRRNVPSADRKLFVARLSGHTNAYSYRADADTLTITPASTEDIWQSLLDSHFVPIEWSIRPDAKHAKSKTYTRKQVQPHS